MATLQSVIQDQVEAANAVGFPAADLSQLKPDELKTFLASDFVDELKNSSSELHQRLCCLVVDESAKTKPLLSLRSDGLKRFSNEDLDLNPCFRFVLHILQASFKLFEMFSFPVVFVGVDNIYFTRKTTKNTLGNMYVVHF